MEVMDAAADGIEQWSSRRSRRIRKFIMITKDIGVHHSLHTGGY